MMTKQKIVLQVDMPCDKCRTKVKKIAAVTDGVSSLAIDGPDKNRLVLIGVGIDTAALINALRKKAGRTYIISVEEVKPEDAKKKEEEAKKKKEAEEKKKKEEEEAKKKMVTWENCHYYAPSYLAPPPPGYERVCYGAPKHPNTWFTW